MSKRGPTPQNDDDINDLLEKKRLEALAEMYNIPGFSASYINRNGHITTMPVGVEANSKGLDVSKDSIFCAASLSKPVFAYLVLRLAAAKEIGLDDTLDTFFKSKDLESGPQVSEWVKNDKLLQLTPRMVLQHRTGLPIGGPKGDIEFQFEPGQNYGYSGIGIQCLQEAIEAKTGKKLEHLAKEYVFKYCEMDNSSFKPTEDSPMKDPYVAANSLHTTAEEYAKFLMRWMNDDVVEYAFGFDQDFTMQKDPWAMGMKSIESDEIELLGIKDDDLDNIAWGVGVGLERKEDTITAFHSGDATDTRAFMAFNLKDKTAFVYLSNSDTGLALVDEIASKTVPLENALNYLFQKYGFERKFQDGWQEREQARMKRIIQEFPPSKPFPKPSKRRMNSDAVTPQYDDKTEAGLSKPQLDEKPEPKPTDEVEVKVYDPVEEDPSKKWKKVKIKK